jgi:hypothetical protein
MASIEIFVCRPIDFFTWLGTARLLGMSPRPELICLHLSAHLNVAQVVINELLPPKFCYVAMKLSMIHVVKSESATSQAR